MSNFSLLPFVLDGFPRTGSTTLTRILNLHPDISCCMEPFHPKRYGGEFNRLALQDDSVASPVALIQQRWNGLKHVWEPGTGWPFVGRPTLNDSLLYHANIIISLRRRNLLRQLVSGYVSRRLGFWVGTAEEFNARLDSANIAPLTVAEAEASLAVAKDALDKRDDLLRNLPAKQLVLFYEDIFEAREGDAEQQRTFCNWLFMELGHTALNSKLFTDQLAHYFDPARYRWANSDVYSRVPGTMLIDEKLGSELNGRLFT